MNELVFEVTQEADGDYVAECLTETIVTDGDNWNQLSANVHEATRGYFFDTPGTMHANIRLRTNPDEFKAAN